MPQSITATTATRLAEWRRLRAEAIDTLNREGITVTVLRGNAEVRRPHPALTVLERAEKMILLIEKTYGVQEEELPDVLDKSLAVPPRTVLRSNSERKSASKSRRS